MKSTNDPRYIEMIGRLRRAREVIGLDQRELAARVGKPQSYVSKIETGERRVDLVETLDICRAIGIELEAVIPGELRLEMVGKP